MVHGWDDVCLFVSQAGRVSTYLLSNIWLTSEKAKLLSLHLFAYFEALSCDLSCDLLSSDQAGYSTTPKKEHRDQY
jgi:hypothetical protein